MSHPTLSTQGGFSFDHCQRNAALESSLSGLKAPAARKTGTTIAGLVFQDGVVLGADTRATDDMVVANKNCDKIHFIAPNIYCCGAGVAADAEMTTQMLSSNIELHALSTGRKPRLATVTRMLRQMLFRYQGHIGTSLIVGGVDITGPHLYSVSPHGSSQQLFFTAMGSGQAAAIATLEDRFKPNMTLEEAQQLVAEAVTSGIMNDLGSGSNVDLCIITQEGVQSHRPYSIHGQKGERQSSISYKPGITAVLSETVKLLPLELVEEAVQTMEVE
ncbi:proteasome subunit beta type-10 [Tachyglossus aculeatus]|uniref:proteasome subunit beta type-10 n=1 Tax=Tachyglossus aculeatus TaxID=9261 RepID=UPI0018F5513F|nr:proteasome subunit beta type-10 [Tachyglossus aculeatus]